VSANRFRRFGRTLAAGAALLVAVALGLSVYAANRPALDLEGLALRHDVDARERHAKQWLSERGLPTALPYDFDFALCTGFGFEDVQGREVPVLHFQVQDPKNPIGFAKVYFLRDGKFNLKDAAHEASSSFQTVLRVPGGPAAPGFTFLILHTGELKLFLRPVPNQF
jgi:hypothetical protein